MVEARQIHLRSHETHTCYVDEGEGVPTLFFHGNPDSLEVWSPTVAALGRGLAPRLRCIVPDLPGFGRTRVPRAYPYTLDHMAEFAVELLDTLGIRVPVNVVVHNAGAFFGLSTVARHPERVRKLVILNAPFFADYRYHFWARVCRVPLLGELGMALLNRPLFGWEMRRGSSRIPDAHIAGSYARVTPRMKRHVLRMYRALPPSAFAGWEEAMRAATAKIPTLVLWGDKDPYVPRRYAGRFGGTVRHLSAGHWPQVEMPEVVAQHLEEFLS